MFFLLFFPGGLQRGEAGAGVGGSWGSDGDTAASSCVVCGQTPALGHGRWWGAGGSWSLTAFARALGTPSGCFGLVLVVPPACQNQCCPQHMQGGSFLVFSSEDPCSCPPTKGEREGCLSDIHNVPSHTDFSSPLLTKPVHLLSP